MTPAELKTLRESLGIPVAWLADKAKVQRRTVEYWEAGRSAVPNDVADLLNELDQQFDRAALQALKDANAKTGQNEKNKTIELLRYREDVVLWSDFDDMQGLPVSAHAMLLFRSKKLMEAHGFSVEINYAQN